MQIDKSIIQNVHILGFLCAVWLLFRDTANSPVGVSLELRSRPIYGSFKTFLYKLL